MDSRAFDELSKRLAEKTSRGRALKLFGGALVGTFVGSGIAHAGPPQKHCKYARYSCQRNIDCCSNNCCNRICCDDGMTCCGGECIRCPAGQTVDPNTCECVGGTPGPVCGNGFCEAGESCTSCPDDCGPCPPTCPNDVCDAGETCQTCPEDCGPCEPECGDGFCDEAAGETCESCPQDCGQCPGCQTANDCPPGGQCETVTCSNGTCVYTPNDDLCPPAQPGSCHTAACVNGTCTFVEDPTNVPTCVECFFGTCLAGGQPFCQPAPPGTQCSNGFCDGAGQCVPQCTTANDCPGFDTECQQRTCIAGICGFTFAPLGTTCGAGGFCDGAGACIGG
jgi:hypothetical protein